jgi:superfamily II DNA or RNA helicase
MFNVNIKLLILDLNLTIDRHGMINHIPGGIDAFNNFLTNEGNIGIGSLVMDEGVDIRNVDAGMLLGGGKSTRKLIQRIGRIIRPKSYLNIGLIFDFNDKYHYMTKRHTDIRRKVVDYEQYPVIEEFDDIMALARKLSEEKKKYLDSRN